LPQTKLYRMSTAQRSRDRGTLRGQHWLTVLAKEFRDARLSLGLSQQHVADAAGIARSVYSLVERAKFAKLPVMIAARIAAVLGLDLYVALYPGARTTRDAASAAKLATLLGRVGAPLQHRTEVPLARTSGRPEQRSWDGMVFGAGERTGIELEMRLYDVQAQRRRHNLKRQDDPVDYFLLVIADTRHNRAVLRAYPELFADLPRLRTVNVFKALGAGKHPGTGLILL